MSISCAIFDTFVPYAYAVDMTWTKQNDTHTAKAGDYVLRVWQSRQFGSYSWAVVRGHIVKAGNTEGLEDAQRAAQAAAEALSES